MYSPAMQLEDQIAWYDRKYINNQRFFKRIKSVEICSAGLIPLLAALNQPHALGVTDGIGAAITVPEGLLQLK
jgi:hypothetical protein